LTVSPISLPPGAHVPHMANGFANDLPWSHMRYTQILPRQFEEVRL